MTCWTLEGEDQLLSLAICASKRKRTTIRIRHLRIQGLVGNDAAQVKGIWCLLEESVDIRLELVVKRSLAVVTYNSLAHRNRLIDDSVGTRCKGSHFLIVTEVV
jgi:hypothetical protein